MYDDRRKQKNRSEILRQQRTLRDEEHFDRINRKAAQVQKSNAPVNHSLNLLNFRNRKKDQASQNKTSSNRTTNLIPLVKEKKPKKIHLSWRILSGLLVILFGVGIASAWSSPDYQVKEIEVKGTQRISKEEVASVLDVLGQPIIMIKPDEISQKIAYIFPEFKKIEVIVSLPGHITLEVVERQPTFAWQLQNRTLWVDSDGFVFPARGQANEMLTIQSDSLPSFYNPELYFISVKRFSSAIFFNYN